MVEEKQKNQEKEKYSEIKDNVKILFVFYIITLVFLSFLIYQIYTLKNDLKEAKESFLNKINTMKKNLNLFKIETEKKLNSLKEEIYKNKNGLIDLENKLEISVKNLKNKINENKKELNSVKYKLDVENKKILDLNNTLNKLNQSINTSITTLSYNISSIKEDINNINNKYTETVKTTFEKLRDIKDKINKLDSEIENKIDQIYELNSQISDLKEDINILNEKIKNKLIWIGMNSKIDSSNPMIEKIETECKKENTLNLACVWYFLHDVYGIHYIYDDNDQLASIDETLSKKGGDCEDLSFLFSAIVRSIPHKNVKYIVDSEGTKAVLYNDGKYIYYIPNAEYKEAIDNDKIYVVCGVDSDGTGGHCLNVVCNSEFDKKIPIKNFVYEHCIIVEPQKYAHISSLKNICFLITNQDICADNNGINFCLSDMVIN